MILTEFFAMLKYGINILLIGLGIISFESINQSQPIHQLLQKPTFEKVNYVERLQEENMGFRDNLYYLIFESYMQNEKDSAESNR